MASLIISSGELLVISGKAAIHEDCCCCDSCESADLAGGPEYYKVTFSGITDCGTPSIPPCSDLNGSWILECTEAGNTDLWRYHGGSAGTPFVDIFNSIGGDGVIHGDIERVGQDDLCFRYDSTGTHMYCPCAACPYDNDQVVGDCGSPVFGYGGTASYIPCDSLGNPCSCPS